MRSGLRSKNRLVNQSVYTSLAFVFCLLLLHLLVGCSTEVMDETPDSTQLDQETSAGTVTHTSVVQTVHKITDTKTVTSATSPSATQLEIRTPSPTTTRTPTVTHTPIPTYSILRGEVLIRSNCRYDPGAPYLYKYGLVPGSNFEIIGRNDAGSWLLVQAIGGDNPCWVKSSLMEVQGEIMNLAPTSLPLPQSPYYGPLRAVSAHREGDTITIFWGRSNLGREMKAHHHCTLWKHGSVGIKNWCLPRLEWMKM